MLRAFVVSAAEILAQETCSLFAEDYDRDAKRASLLREAGRLRGCAAKNIARAEKIEAEASTLAPNRTYITDK